MTNYVEICMSGIRCRVEDPEAETIFAMRDLLKYALRGVGYHESSINEILPDDFGGISTGPVTLDIDINDIADQWGHNSFGGFQATFHGQAERNVHVSTLRDGTTLRLHFKQGSQHQSTPGWYDHPTVLYTEATNPLADSGTDGEAGQVRSSRGKSLDDCTPAEWSESSRAVMAEYRSKIC